MIANLICDCGELMGAFVANDEFSDKDIVERLKCLRCEAEYNFILENEGSIQRFSLRKIHQAKVNPCQNN